MITVEEALGLLKLHSSPANQVATVALTESFGMLLAEEVTAERPQPPFNRVAMDGIAITAKAFEEGHRQFPVEFIQAAGEAPRDLLDYKSCAEIMTGAALPSNLDGVIPYELVTITDGIATVSPQVEFTQDKNIHKMGSDHAAGELLLANATKITSPVISILASEGLSEVKVYKTPKIAVITTGNELVEIDCTPLAHQIRRSNAYTLKAELCSFGLENVELFHLPDSPEKLLLNLEKILADFQVVILSGGVSKGKFDFIPSTLADLGVKKIFHKIMQKPGKPFWYGVGGEGQQVYALPGNPVSCLINLRKYLIPLLTMENCHRPVKIAFEFSQKNSLTKFIPVQLDHLGNATRLSSNGSGDYFSLKESHGFVEFQGSIEKFESGSVVKFYPWGGRAC